ncbi:hypothetical protein PENSPDRAFT_656716 [Peniophora sp. CONT]|nr:hypothetical protein PENSPDRAFT_656716 [Peniophora sp. CONT]
MSVIPPAKKDTAKPAREATKRLWSILQPGPQSASGLPTRSVASTGSPTLTPSTWPRDSLPSSRRVTLGYA